MVRWVEHAMRHVWHRDWALPLEHHGAVADRDRSAHTIGDVTLLNSQLISSLLNEPWRSNRIKPVDHSALVLNEGFANKRLIRYVEVRES